METFEIKRRLQHCIANLYANDSDLFTRNNYELTISAKLAQYLFIEFEEFHVDCEYDRHIDAEKYSEELARNIRPDIVVHCRGTDDKNLLYIEIKKTQNTANRLADREKVIAVTRANGQYHYSLGVFLDFAPTYNRMIQQYFIDGVEIT